MLGKRNIFKKESCVFGNRKWSKVTCYHLVRSWL